MTHPHRQVFVAVAVAIVAQVACAVDVELTRIDGRVFRGRLTAVSPEITVVTDGGGIKLPWTDVLGVRPSKPSSAPAPPANSALGEEFDLRFLLADGSTFAGAVAEGAEREFVVRLEGDRSCRLDPTLVRSITSRTAAAAAQRKLVEALKELDATSDIAIVAKGEQAVELRGAVRQINAASVLFAWNNQEKPLPWQRVAGIVFARPAGRRASSIVTLSSGDVFAGRVAGGDEQSITLQSSVFESLSIPWSDVVRIDCNSDRLTFLSDMPPARYDFEPFFDKKWAYALDKTLTGRPIQLDKQLYAKGVVMHSRAKLMWRLNGEFHQFAALAGIVDEMNGRGCVTMRVFGDGDLLWEAEKIRGGRPPESVSVRVTEVRELELQVDYDDDVDLSDHAAWAFARLIK